MASKLSSKKEFSKIEKDINDSQDKNDYYDDNMMRMSERTYNKLASDIVKESIGELKNTANSNRKYKLYVAIVFTCLLIAFTSVLICLLKNNKEYSLQVIIVYVGTFMVELVVTLQMVIRLVFENDYQTEVIEILHKFLENFQKYK